MGRIYYVQANNLAVTTTDDFLQLRQLFSSDRVLKIHEIRVWQESDTAGALNAITIRRGIGASDGTALTSRLNDVTDAGPVHAGSSLSPTPLSIVDFEMQLGWDILHEFIWFPIPTNQIRLTGDDALTLSLRTADTLTIGASIWWEERGQE